MAFLLGMNFDPDDDDFGKINVKRGSMLEGVLGEDAQDMHFDAMAGLDMPLQLAFRTAGGLLKSLINWDRGYMFDALNKNQRELLMSKRGEPRFLRGKLSPSASWAVDAFVGKDYIGRDYTHWGALTSRILPLSWGQVYDAALYDRFQAMEREPITMERAGRRLKENEIKFANALATLLFTFTGVGVTQYPKSELTKATEKARSFSNYKSTKPSEQLRVEGALRSFYKEKFKLMDEGKSTSKIDAKIEHFYNENPALIKSGKRLRGQAKSRTGLLGFYAKDLTVSELNRIIPLANTEEREMLVKIREKKAKKNALANH